MHLLHLPPELFRRIILMASLQNGAWRKITRLRLVCKIFDVEIQRAMYAAPPFPTHLRTKPVRRIPEYMSHAMTRRLILSKMIREGALFSYTIMRGIDVSDMIRDDAGQRPLCCAILRTLAYLDSKFHMKEPDWRRRCIEGLVTAVAMALPLKNIVEILALPTHGKNYLQNRDLPPDVIILTPRKRSFVDSLPQDALICALITGQAELAKVMLDQGVDGVKESPIFGSPISVASYMGLVDTVDILAPRSLRQIESPGSKYNPNDPVNKSSSTFESFDLAAEKPVIILPRIQHKTPLYTQKDRVLHGAVLKNCARAVQSILSPGESQHMPRTSHGTSPQALSFNGIEEAIYLALRYKQRDIVSMLIQHNVCKYMDSPDGHFCEKLIERLSYTTRKTLQESVDKLFQDDPYPTTHAYKFPFCIHESGIWGGDWVDTVYPVKTRSLKMVFGVEVIQQLLSKAGEQNGQMLNFLIHHGADINYKYPDRRSHPIVRAAVTGNLYQMKHFVYYGMDFHNDHCASQALAMAINITASGLQLESVSCSQFSHCINFLLHAGASAKEALDGSVDGRPIPDFVKVDEGALAGLNYRTRTHIMRKYTESEQNTQFCA